MARNLSKWQEMASIFLKSLPFLKPPKRPTGLKALCGAVRKLGILRQMVEMASKKLYIGVFLRGVQKYAYHVLRFFKNTPTSKKYSPFQPSQTPHSKHNTPPRLTE